MEIYFLRHAQAEEANGLMSDADRQLTERGIRHTRRMTQALKELDVIPDRLYSSPLVRAKQTAEIVAAGLGLHLEIKKELGPGFTLAGLHGLTRDLGMQDQVMVVGHEPDFSKVIADFIGGGRIVIKKCGLARVEVVSFQPLRGELLWLFSPKIAAHVD
ncbi:MAG: phosphohistidine phosphatase SixA [bacterium]|nr:phosphohistidine phosphatase SixA [bacterium]